jgi:hypothetical protein
MNTSNTQIPHIDQRTIECDLSAFTRWLNALADQVNWLTNVYLELKEQVDINTEDIRKLKIRVTNLETRMDNLENRVTNLEEIVNNLDLDAIQRLIDMVNNRIDLLYSWLPVPYGMIPSLGWKFAMGNINATSTTDAPTDINGPGIYTSGAIEDNDINFK